MWDNAQLVTGVSIPPGKRFQLLGISPHLPDASSSAVNGRSLLLSRDSDNRCSLKTHTLLSCDKDWIADFQHVGARQQPFLLVEPAAKYYVLG